MAYNKITDFSLNEGNPFLPATVVHVEKGEKTLLFGQKNPDLIIDSDSQVKGHSLFARKVTVDKAKFMKVFMSGLTNWFDLSKPAIKVFAYIAETLEPNRDSVEFSLEKCKAFTGFKAQKTILSALAELAANQFIARGPHPYKYFINPTIFFNGDRLTFIEQYEVEKEGQDKLEEPVDDQSGFKKLAQELALPL
ncbi:MAG: hypothetical protein EOP33_08890 [Rickettsiaceae bacterium]|nr:MAG: hypothetical protein EOP33_08890 [Rickettsiaceae bacterium]